MLKLVSNFHDKDFLSAETISMMNYFPENPRRSFRTETPRTHPKCGHGSHWSQIVTDGHSIGCWVPLKAMLLLPWRSRGWKWPNPWGHSVDEHIYHETRIAENHSTTPILVGRLLKLVWLRRTPGIVDLVSASACLRLLIIATCTYYNHYSAGKICYTITNYNHHIWEYRSFVA